MLSNGTRPEDTTRSLNTYHTERAAFVWGKARDAHRILKDMGEALSHDDKRSWLKGVKALNSIRSDLDRYPPFSENDNTLSGTCYFVQDACQKPHHESKRKNARHLPLNWRGFIWKNLTNRTRNKAAVAVLMLVAPRPAELEYGVTVSTYGKALIVGIEGAKFIEGKRGQKIRGIRIKVVSSEAQYLFALAKNSGGTVVIKASSVSGLNKLLVRTGRRVLGKRITVSAYDYRHALASDLKAAGRSQEEIAIVLGHQSSRTQTCYGQTQQSRGSRIHIVAVKGSEPVSIHHRSFDFASDQQCGPTLPLKC